MNISKITALEIQTNDDTVISCDAGTLDNKKYAGLIFYMKDDYIHKTLIESSPCFDSADEAILAMKKIVNEIRALDLVT